MENLTVTYRSEIHSTHIASLKLISDLKDIISKRTNIKRNNFELKFQNFIADDHKFISDFTKDGSTFAMVNVSIDVVLVLNDVNHSFCVKELAPIRNFLDNIYRLTGHDREISLHFNGKELEVNKNLAFYGVEHGSILRAVNGKPRSIRRIAIRYLKVVYTIDIDQRKTVLDLKKRVSELTNIKSNHFSLQLDNFCLCDHNAISTYINDGSRYKMVNVIIRVDVVLNEKEYEFYVKEESMVNDFKKNIATRTGIFDNITLYNRDGVLGETNTMLESGIKNNDLLIAVIDNTIISGTQEFTVTYRNDIHTIAMDTSNTVLKLKEKVSDFTNIQHFELTLYWMSLNDDEPLSEYVKYGTKLQMMSAIIKIYVKLDQRIYNFLVNEDLTVSEVVKEVKRKSGMKSLLILIYQGDILFGQKTLKDNEVYDGCTLVASSTLSGG